MPVWIRHSHNHFTCFDVVKPFGKCLEFQQLISVIIVHLLSWYDADVISAEQLSQIHLDISYAIAYLLIRIIIVCKDCDVFTFLFSISFSQILLLAKSEYRVLRPKSISNPLPIINNFFAMIIYLIYD